MKKTLITALLLIAVAFLAAGCPFIISSEHTRAHAKAMNYHLIEMHKFVDRHFWLYDWEDPYVN